MKPRVKPQDSGVEELFRAKLKNIINMRHELVRLGDLIDWGRLEVHFALYYSAAGRPGLPIRLLVGLHLLKHIEGLSDEAVCERWERDPYMQYFCGEEYFQHSFPLERSGMTHFRHRVRAGTGNVATGNAGSRAPGRGAERESDRSGGGGHHGARESDLPSDRARAVADGHRAVGGASEEKRIAFAAVLRAGGAACGDENRTLPARAAKEAREETGEIHARTAASFAARHTTQDGSSCWLSGKASEAVGDRAGQGLAYRAAAARRSRLSLFLACDGSGMHQQGQSTRAVRVRLQSFPGHQSASGQRRALPSARTGAARKSVRRPYPGGRTGRHSQDRGARAATRGRRSRIQGSSHHPATHRGLHHRTETRRDGKDQTMAETPRGRGTGHRSRQKRRFIGTQLAGWPRR